MRRWALLILWLLAPMAARANPVVLNPSSLIAFGIVAFAALLVEAGIVSLVLAFAGIAPLKFFGAFFFANVAVFVFVFQPLLERQSAPLPVLELLVVVLDAAAIKLLSRFGALQGDGYRGVSWRLAGTTALAGNAVSFFVGVIASGAPWEVHGIPE